MGFDGGGAVVAEVAISAGGKTGLSVDVFVGFPFAAFSLSETGSVS